MAATPAAVHDFLELLSTKLRPTAQQQQHKLAQLRQDVLREQQQQQQQQELELEQPTKLEDGGEGRVPVWDLRYYSRIQMERYEADAAAAEQQ